MDPFKPTKNKPLTPAWWKEVFLRWVGFMKQAVTEIAGKVKGK